MRKLVVANFKMNMSDLRPWRRLRVPRGAEVVICPPFPYLSDVRRHVSGVRLGAQDCFWAESGAYTGEVSPAMLKSLGAKYVILGHSERRNWLGETDEMVNKKVRAALKAGLKVILCVGEPLAVRRKGLVAAKRFVAAQLRKDLNGIHSAFNKKSPRRSASSPRQSELVVAYEPRWAIGTGRADKPEETVEMAKFIKSVVERHLSDAKRQMSNVRVLYGGSVTSKNAANFLKHKEIDGALVGGASLNPGEFGKIIRSARKS